MVVEGHCVHAHRFDLLEDVNPQLGDRNAEWMEFAAEGEDSLSIDHQTVIVPLHCCVARFSVSYWPVLVCQRMLSSDKQRGETQSVDPPLTWKLHSGRQVESDEQL